MDLLQTVRKEGSRGGVNFSWGDVKTSQHRENYLGHSLMAPVGRWQKNKDLGWYARAEDAELTPEQRLEKERERKREEMRKVKEAEEDAMAKALGLPVPERRNANEEPLGMSGERQKEVNKALEEALADEDEKVDEERGIGFGRYGAVNGDGGKEVLKGSRSRRDEGSRRESRRNYDEDEDERSVKRRRRSRSRSRDRYRERRHRHRHHDRSRSRSKERTRRRSRSRDGRRDKDERQRRQRDYEERSRSREKDRRRRSRSRSRSPYERRRGGNDR